MHLETNLFTITSTRIMSELSRQNCQAFCFITVSTRSKRFRQMSRFCLLFCQDFCVWNRPNPSPLLILFLDHSKWYCCPVMDLLKHISSLPTGPCSFSFCSYYLLSVSLSFPTKMAMIWSLTVFYHCLSILSISCHSATFTLTANANTAML